SPASNCRWIRAHWRRSCGGSTAACPAPCNPEPSGDQAMSENLEGQVVLVTGAGRGIGGATARLLAARGAAVGVFDIDADLARATTEAIEAAGGKAMAFAADASDRKAVFGAAAALAGAFGPMTGIVNDAIFIRYG